jgi:hypothetical protein
MLCGFVAASAPDAAPMLMANATAVLVNMVMSPTCVHTFLGVRSHYVGANARRM